MENFRVTSNVKMAFSMVKLSILMNKVEKHLKVISFMENNSPQNPSTLKEECCHGQITTRMERFMAIIIHGTNITVQKSSPAMFTELNMGCGKNTTMVFSTLNRYMTMEK